MKTEDWLVMVGNDGTVAAVEGGAPASWLRRRVEECAGMPDAVRTAARGFVRDLSLPGGVVRRRSVPSEREGEPAFTLLAVEAIPLRPAGVALDPLMRRALEPLVHQAEAAHVVVRMEVAPDFPRELCVDADKIAWAMTVLVGNALRHVRRGSPSLPGGQIVARLGHTAAQRMVSISVEDDGQGIPTSVRPWLFEPDPETGRVAGVALRLVHDVVAAHGGGMVIRSSTEAEARGTTVTLWLPIR